MANSFKTLLPEDVATTRTLLHEAIPITASIVSGTYDDENIKYFAHGMYEAVYDYPYLSSSANHIFDITAGYSADSDFSSATRLAHDELDTAGSEQNSKKMNIYNQMAQVLVGYDVSGSVREFDFSGSTAPSGEKMKSAYFINFSRLLTKDEIKKDSFRLKFFAYYPHDGAFDSGLRDVSGRITIGDYGAQTSYKTNSPAGEYALLYTSSQDIGTDPNNMVMGHLYYQAGIAVLQTGIISSFAPTSDKDGSANFSPLGETAITASVGALFKSGTIDQAANAFRFALDDISFNNTTELNSSIYFCRANNTEFNYSSNPTYLSQSQIVVKGNNPMANPVSYVTSVGLYSPDNELLAVAKLSEPLKKSPSNELTLRVRLDY